MRAAAAEPRPAPPRGALLLLAALLLAASAAPADGQEQQQRRRRVVIVGAGLAGVAAARELADSGAVAPGDVLLLEARDRVGGRLHSVNTSAGAVDLGAMWVHGGAPGNPVFDLATQLGLHMSRPHDYNSATLANPDGTPMNRLLYMATYAGFMRDVRGRIGALRAAAASAANGSAAALPPADLPLSALVSEWVESSRPTWRAEQVPMANLIMHSQFQTLLNANVTELSTLRFGDAKVLPEVDVLFEEGYDAVTRRLLPSDADVSLNTTVVSINQTAGGVAVTTSNGTTLLADHAIVTLPLGVLKEGGVAFAPPLPEAKQKAIRDMGMGVLDKLVLVWRPDQVFWDKGFDFIAYASEDWSGRWSSWLNYYKMWRTPVLVALTPADTARQLEGMTDAEVVADAMQALRRIFAGRDVPDPLEAHVTRWAADPHARGAYSFFATGNALNITNVIAEPHASGRILFAGEAASSKPGTTTGALISGRREAQRLLAGPLRAPSAGGAASGVLDPPVVADLPAGAAAAALPAAAAVGAAAAAGAAAVAATRG